GRAYGRHRGGRGLPQHVEPQLPRPHGPPEGRGLPVEPGGGRGDRGRGRDHPPSRGAREGAGGGMTHAALRGRAWTFGTNVDTDQIIPAKYAIYSLDEKKLGEHAMEGVPEKGEGFSKRISPGDVIVAGPNFGCGSSREIAPI